MTCPFFNAGRCSLAEKHAEGELRLSLECHTNEATCEECLKAGHPCEVKPSIPCVGLVTRQLSGRALDAWRKYVGWILFGKSRGLGDTIAKVTKATGIDRAVKAIAGEDCGCGRRQSKLNKVLPYQSDSHSSIASVQEKSSRGGP